MKKLLSSVCGCFCLLIAVRAICFLAQPAAAFAVDQYIDPETRYQIALRDLKTGKILDSAVNARSAFLRMDWVGKTAFINLACHPPYAKVQVCQDILRTGLTDKALVVRDHSLRTLLGSEFFESAVKERVARSVLNDERNYRRGKELWIVRNARSFLLSESNSNDSKSQR